jgi:hypothetical protein
LERKVAGSDTLVDVLELILRIKKLTEGGNLCVKEA